MTKREVVSLTCRLLGIYYLLSAVITTLAGLVYLSGITGASSSDLMVFLIEDLTIVVGALLLIVAGTAIAGAVFPGEEHPPISSRLDLAEAGLAAVGVYVFASAIPPLGSAVNNVLYRTANQIPLHTSDYLPAALGALLFVVMGLWLIKSAKRRAHSITGEAQEMAA